VNNPLTSHFRAEYVDVGWEYLVASDVVVVMVTVDHAYIILRGEMLRRLQQVFCGVGGDECVVDDGSVACVDDACVADGVAFL